MKTDTKELSQKIARAVFMACGDGETEGRFLEVLNKHGNPFGTGRRLWEITQVIECMLVENEAKETSEEMDHLLRQRAHLRRELERPQVEEKVYRNAVRKALSGIGLDIAKLESVAE